MLFSKFIYLFFLAPFSVVMLFICHIIRLIFFCLYSIFYSSQLHPCLLTIQNINTVLNVRLCKEVYISQKYSFFILSNFFQFYFLINLFFLSKLLNVLEKIKLYFLSIILMSVISVVIASF